MFKMIAESTFGNDKRSSKRIIMYIFVFLFLIMVLLFEGTYNAIKIFKWASGSVKNCEFGLVFDPILYGYIIGLITSIAAVNAFGKQNKKAQENFDEKKDLM